MPANRCRRSQASTASDVYASAGSIVDRPKGSSDRSSVDRVDRGVRDDPVGVRVVVMKASGRSRGTMASQPVALTRATVLTRETVGSGRGPEEGGGPPRGDPRGDRRRGRSRAASRGCASPTWPPRSAAARRWSSTTSRPRTGCSPRPSSTPSSATSPGSTATVVRGRDATDKVRRILRLYAPQGAAPGWTLRSTPGRRPCARPSCARRPAASTSAGRRRWPRSSRTASPRATFTCADPNDAAWRLTALLDGLSVQVTVYGSADPQAAGRVGARAQRQPSWACPPPPCAERRPHAHTIQLAT